MCQPDLIVKMERIFEEHVSSLQTYKTPAAPGEIITKPVDENEKVDGQKQRLYRSGVGMLLYLIKFSRPEISNAVRELSKVMDSAAQAHVKGLYRAIKYTLDS